MSLMAKLDEIKQTVGAPLLDVQNELEGGLLALSGLRTLLQGQSEPGNEGLEELVGMIEDRFRRVDGLLRGMNYQVFGPEPRISPR